MCHLVISGREGSRKESTWENAGMGFWKDLHNKVTLKQRVEERGECEECRCLGNRECEGSTVEACLACPEDSQEDCVALRGSSDR